MAIQINNIRKILLESGNNITINRVSINLNPNVGFFLNFMQKNYPQQVNSSLFKGYRVIDLIPPNLSKIFTVIAEADGESAELGSKVVQIYTLVKDTFQNDYYH